MTWAKKEKLGLAIPGGIIAVLLWLLQAFMIAANATGNAEDAFTLTKWLWAFAIGLFNPLGLLVLALVVIIGFVCRDNLEPLLRFFVNKAESRAGASK